MCGGREVTRVPTAKVAARDRVRCEWPEANTEDVANVRFCADSCVSHTPLLRGILQPLHLRRRLLSLFVLHRAREKIGEAVEIEIDYRRREQRQRLANQSGRRPSHNRAAGGFPHPVPVPSISGTPPSNAAIVVIMIGRKRNRAARRIDCGATDVPRVRPR